MSPLKDNKYCIFIMYNIYCLTAHAFNTTRTKTSIRYAKENDRVKRERKKGRMRDIEREGEIRERERERERGERDR